MPVLLSCADGPFPFPPPPAEIITFDNVIVVYKFVGDLMFYVTGSADENEIILYSVLNGFVDGISLLLRHAGGQGCLETVVIVEGAGVLLLGMGGSSRGVEGPLARWSARAEVPSPRPITCAFAGMRWRRRRCWRIWTWCC